MPPKDVQVHYVGEIVKLMLWYMYQLMSNLQISFSVVLTDYVDIYRKTSFFNLNDASETQRLKPKWSECAAKLNAIFEMHLSNKRPAAELEQQGLRLLWPYLVERVERGLPLVEYRENTTFGCFFYNLNDRVIDLHFVNKIMPEAPFTKLLGRAAELYKLLLHCKEDRPQIQKIKCGSWLNDYPPFCKLFPSTWQDSGERRSYNSLGWWGQFVNHYGDIHAHNAKQFRDTSNFPYQCTYHQCEIDDLRRHLRGLLEAGD